MQKKKETIESEVLECLQEIEEFEEDDDYLCIEMYGGGPDESFLKGTKNALRLFALDILRKSCEIENESGIVGCFDPASEIRIDYIVASNNEGVYSKEHSTPFKEKLIGYMLFVLLIIFLISAVIGFITILKNIF